MAALPPLGWEDLATRKDLDLLRHELVSAFRGEFITQTRTIIISLVATLIAFAGVVLAAIRLQ